MRCSSCENEIYTCDECGENFEIGEDIKCTEQLGIEHQCESCFNDSYTDEEVENE